jgi:ribosomal protein L37AE/L43A
MDIGTKQGTVECPYCGHQIAERVKYAGQTLNCQKCTSACTAPTYSERLSPAYLAKKESKERKRNIEFEAAQKDQQAHYDDHFKWWLFGFSIVTGLYATGGFVAILMGQLSVEDAGVVTVIGFIFFLYVLRYAVPQKYVSKEAMKRVERRQRDKQEDSTTPVNPRDTGHE